MENVEYKVEKGKLVITVDLAKRLRPSGSGKTMIIATTAGNEKVKGAEHVTFGLNVYTKEGVNGSK
jgi:ABC-type polar amino acid transport system ATPase subunit